MFADPQVKHLGLAAPVEHKRLGQTELVASPVNISGLPRRIRTPTPERGEHTEEILRGLGYDEAEIADLRSKGAI